jgi:hypothetical protein
LSTLNGTIARSRGTDDEDLPRRLDDFDGAHVNLIDLEDARDLRQETHDDPQVAPVIRISAMT